MLKLDTRLIDIGARRSALAASIRGRRLLYLDFKYWNFFCDVELGEETSAELRELYEQLKEEVKTGRVLCPVEASVFFELCQHPHPTKRLKTAEVIDLLSHGVTILAPQERIFLEALCFLQSVLHDLPFPAAPWNEVWTRPAFVLFHGQLTAGELPADYLDQVDKAFKEYLWNYGYTDMLALIPDITPSYRDELQRSADSLNARKGRTNKPRRGLRETYLAQIRALLTEHGDTLGLVVLYLYLRAGNSPQGVQTEGPKRAGQELANLIASAFDTHDLSAQLPTVHVMAALYADMERDLARRYRGNDFPDFGHASAALGYCHAFATERSLAALVRRAKLDIAYNVRVLARPVEVREWILNQ